jgi:excisionase family DNA binding protein
MTPLVLASPRAELATLTARDVADLSGVHIDTVRKWTRSGRLTVVRTPGGRPRYLRSEVEAMVRGETTGATS